MERASNVSSMYFMGTEQQIVGNIHHGKAYCVAGLECDAQLQLR
ncbi:hypothetical protein [Methanosarcina sp. UBA5]|nr:hypothetical protein [Methanosarcina sp. UBA5]